MDGYSTEEMARQNLLDRILNCVKQVQVHFGAKQEIATESDVRVSAMCTEWEMLLSHGAKKSKPKNALRLTGRNEGVSLWPLAKLCLSTEDLQRFIRLDHVQTEVGRGRAWLRAAINERTLENYLHIVLGQEEQLRKLYEGHAFMLDQERSSMLPVMAAGLSSIIFSIAVDATYLNTPTRSVQVPSNKAPPEARAPITSSSSSKTRPPSSEDHHSYLSFSTPSNQHMRNNSGTSKHGMSGSGEIGPGESDTISSQSAARTWAILEEEDDDVVAVSAKEKKKRHKKSKSKSSHTSSSAPQPPAVPVESASLTSQEEPPVLTLTSHVQEEPPVLTLTSHVQEEPPVLTLTSHVQEEPPILTLTSHVQEELPVLTLTSHVQEELPILTLKESTSSSSSRLSLDLMSEDGQCPTYVAFPKPSSDLVSSEALAAAEATAHLLSAISEPVAVGEEQLAVGGVLGPSSNGDATLPVGGNGGMAHTHTLSQHTSSSSSPSSSAESELRTSMLALSRLKEDLESRNRELTVNMRYLEGRVEGLLLEVERSKQECQQLQEAHAGKKQALERENDLLREQLKKYVSMVQTQWKDTSNRQSNTVSESGSTPTEEKVSHRPSGEGDKSLGEPLTSSLDHTQSVADQKLQQMAEMYGEVMELNDRLHRDLAEKDATICTLVHSIKESRMELPVPLYQLPPTAMETRALVDVWIPSVIKKGRGPDGFHVYQVFVCVKAVEWNIYRRYTEFREFHRQLQKHVPEVTSFSFPPKKAIGNKSAQVVEERRLRLQEYLRFVIKTCSNPRKGKGGKDKLEAVITPTISKATLVTMFPFFKEDFNTDPNALLQSPSYGGL